MSSVIIFTMDAEPPGIPIPGGFRDGVNDALAGPLSANGGPFEVVSRERGGSLPRGQWRVTLAGAIPQGAQAGLITALEAIPMCRAGTVSIEDDNPEVFSAATGFAAELEEFARRAQAGTLPEDAATPVPAPTSLVPAQPRAALEAQPVRLWPLYALAILNSAGLAAGTAVAIAYWWAPLLAVLSQLIGG